MDGFEQMRSGDGVGTREVSDGVGDLEDTTVYAAQPGTDLVSTDSKNFFIPPAGQTHPYDADGNLTADAVWLYTYTTPKTCSCA